MKNRWIWMVSTVFLLAAYSCGPVKKPYTPSTLGYKTPTGAKLKALPAPKHKIYAAVYSFRDQTGQYKYQENVSSFSTAVTQGATAMLIQAMIDSGWFIVVEREGLNNLLTERKIIRAKLDDNKKGLESLPVLYHAPLIIEGGVVGYETNVSTGGFGARYFGIGGSGEYRKDQVSLYLRGVDVTNGQVILSVSAIKSIFSQVVDFGVFRYVAIDRLLEIESGLSTNEPPQMCVLEAIEKAVFSLIVEGVLNGRWDLKDPLDLKNPLILEYLEEKEVDPEMVVAQKLKEDASQKSENSTGTPAVEKIKNEKNIFLEKVMEKTASEE